MAVVYTKKDQGKTLSTGGGVPLHSAIAGDEYTDTTSGIHYVFTTSWAPLSTSTGGLTYFIETGNTASPNTTVPVVALIANSGVTNVDVSIVPKGTGSFMLDIPDNTLNGGDKRGTESVDLQMSRNASTQVASGQRSTLLGGWNSIASGSYSLANGLTNSATNNYSIALGDNNTASGQWSLSVGFSNLANNNGAVALGYDNNATNAATVALGDSNTASGSRSVALGQSNTAGGTNATAIGYLNTSNGFASAVIGYGNSTAYDGNYAFGYANTLTSGPSGNNSNVFAFGIGNTVNASNAVAIGAYGLTNGVTSRQTFSGGRITTNGDAQKSTFFYRGRTTDATLTTLATDGNNSINAGNCMQLANNSAIRFKGTIIGKQSGSTNTVAWDIDGLIVRGSSAASTSLVVGNVNLVSNIPAWGTPVISAYIDAFNGVGAMRIQIQGASSTSIQWTAIIDTTEVIYA